MIGLAAFVVMLLSVGLALLIGDMLGKSFYGFFIIAELISSSHLFVSYVAAVG